MNREENEARIETAHDDVDRCNHGDMLVCIFPAKIERRKKGGGSGEDKSRLVRLQKTLVFSIFSLAPFFKPF